MLNMNHFHCLFPPCVACPPSLCIVDAFRDGKSKLSSVALLAPEENTLWVSAANDRGVIRQWKIMEEKQSQGGMEWHGRDKVEAEWTYKEVRTLGCFMVVTFLIFSQGDWLFDIFMGVTKRVNRVYCRGCITSLNSILC